MLKLSLFIAGLLASTAVYADEAPLPEGAAAAPDAASATVTEAASSAIVVTATRTPIAIDRVPASITVLDGRSFYAGFRGRF
jgi:outer membrane receptor protein involved in Fe transport